jgi:hypothetical protein
VYRYGLGRFADKYMRGLLSGGEYKNIPLEEQAYELDKRYIENPGRIFLVEAEVADWMAKDRY